MTDFVARDPDYQARVRDSFARQGFMHAIGAEIVALAPGRCDIRLAFKPEVSQQHHYFHGGIIATLADNAAGYSSYTLMSATDTVLTVEFKLNILAPGDGDTLIARGHVLKSGRTLTVSRTDVFAVKNGRETLCATLLGTFMRLADMSDRPKAA